MIDQERFFDALHATWPPAQTAEVDGWRVRQGLNGGKRVSAASGSGDVATAEAAMRALGQDPLFRLTSDDESLDAKLEARGYDVVDPTLVYAARVNMLADIPSGERSADSRVESSSGRTKAHEAIWEIRSSTPRAGRQTSFNVIESLSAVIGLHLHRPTVIPKVAGVSVMLAERAASSGRCTWRGRSRGPSACAGATGRRLGAILHCRVQTSWQSVRFRVTGDAIAMLRTPCSVWTLARRNEAIYGATRYPLGESARERREPDPLDLAPIKPPVAPPTRRRDRFVSPSPATDPKHRAPPASVGEPDSLCMTREGRRSPGESAIRLTWNGSGNPYQTLRLARLKVWRRLLTSALGSLQRVWSRMRTRPSYNCCGVAVRSRSIRSRSQRTP